MQKCFHISQQSTCVGVFLNKFAGPQNCNFIKKRLQRSFLLWILWIIQEHLLWDAETLVHLFKNTFFYRTSPVGAASDSFRFPAYGFIKKETRIKMFICEFCKIFKIIFLSEHLQMTASCVYLWILRSFWDYLVYRAPLGNCYFIFKLPSFSHHIQINKFFI